MSLSFYTSIIEEEKKIFNVKDASLKIAAKNVSLIYSSGNLVKGSTFLDYNIPSNRCAYLFRYASIHTTLVKKFFTPMIDEIAFRAILEYKEELKICCLGGGSGTDIIGIFQVLSSFPSFKRKITEVTVLDLCGGWRNSFKHIISRLKHGKVENVPASFIDSENFTANLIEVNLLEPLPAKVVNIIANADIISMVKFVSAVLGKPESVKALKIIGDYIKIGALVLFVDNFHRSTLETFKDISKSCGFSTILGPLYEVCKGISSAKRNDIYGFAPIKQMRVSVAGWIKTHSTLLKPQITTTVSNSFSITNENDSWETESEDEDTLIPLVNKAALKCNLSDNIPVEKVYRDKFTQTYSHYFMSRSDRYQMLPVEEMTELLALINALVDLTVIFNKMQSGKSNICSYQQQLCTEHFCNSIKEVLKSILPILSTLSECNIQQRNGDAFPPFPKPHLFESCCKLKLKFYFS